MEVPVLNKFEKEKMVIELHKQGKTIKQIAAIIHKNFRDISKIIKKYERKIQIEERKKDSGKKQIKRILKSSKAYELFLEGRSPVQVASILDLEFQKVRKYWTEFLRLKNMTKLYNIYIENEFHLDYLFKINYFLLRNSIPIEDMEDVLRTAYDIINLKKIIANLKTEIERLKQMKNNYSSNQNTNKQILPLGLPKYYYEQLL